MNSSLILPSDLKCGYFDCSGFGALKVSPKRVCTMFELEYYPEDAKYSFANEVAYPIRRNWVRICSPGEERYSELPFKAKFVKFSAEGRLADELNKAPRYFYVHQTFEITNLLDEIIEIYTMHSCDDLLLQGKLLTYISLLLSEAICSQMCDLYKYGIIISAQEFIKEHHQESIKLCDIAKAVNLSANYFHTLFTESCGLTPREYLEDYRIKVAKKLLLTTQLTLSEIAEQCGFSSQQYLTTIFKAKVKCPPIRFKQQYQSTYFN